MIAPQSEKPVLFFSGKGAWLTWLARNHAKSSGVLLRFAKKASGVKKRKRRVVAKPLTKKLRIGIRLDRDIVEYFRDQVKKARRGNYQTLINDALKEYIQRPTLAEQVTAEVRTVLHEEFEKMRATT